MRAKRRIFAGSVCEQEVYTLPDRTKDVKKAEPRPRFSSAEEYEDFKQRLARRNHARMFNATFSPALKALEPAKYTALKMCGVLQCKDVWCEMDDVIAIAYETVVEVAEEALERGIAAGVCFDAIACGAVKKKFLRLRKYYGEKCRKADLVSYEAYFPLHNPASSYRFEDRYELREECREAVRTLSPERRRDPYIAELLEAVAL